MPYDPIERWEWEGGAVPTAPDRPEADPQEEDDVRADEDRGATRSAQRVLRNTSASDS